MASLTVREKNLIGVMGGLVCLLVVAIIFQWLGQYKMNMSQQLAQQRRALDQIQQLEKEWLYLNSMPQTPVIPQALSAFVEGVIRQFNLQDKLQLNALPVNPGMEGVQVRLEQINLDQAIDILFTLENNRPVILVEQIEISKVTGSKLLRLAFRVYKQNRV